MEVRLGKWEKGTFKRIYVNHESLGSAKVYAYENKENGQFLIGYDRHGKTCLRQILNVIEAAEKAIAEKVGEAYIGYNTKFTNVWAAV